MLLDIIIAIVRALTDKEEPTPPRRQPSRPPPPRMNVPPKPVAATTLSPLSPRPVQRGRRPVSARKAAPPQAQTAAQRTAPAAVPSQPLPSLLDTTAVARPSRQVLTHEELRRAIVINELLQPPLALRDR